MQISTFDYLEEMRNQRKMFESLVKELLQRGELKSEIARRFEVTVHEITKIQKGNFSNVVEEGFYKEYKKTSSKIYWDCYFEGKDLPDQAIADKYGVELWVAVEVHKIFKNKLFSKINFKNK